MTKTQRAAKANALIKVISGCGRKFFSYPDHHGVSKFEVDGRARIWFVDGYTGRRIYLHYKYWRRGFSEGGTLRALICALKEFIATGEPIPASHLGPWPKYLCDGDLWGYGDDMQSVRACAVELNIIAPAQNKEVMTPNK